MSCNHMVNPFFKRIGDTVTCCKCGEDFTPEEYAEMLKNPPIPDPEGTQGGDPSDLSFFTVKQLAEMAAQNGLSLVGREKKADLIKAIEDARANASGDTLPSVESEGDAQ